MGWSSWTDVADLATPLGFMGSGGSGNDSAAFVAGNAAGI